MAEVLIAGVAVDGDALLVVVLVLVLGGPVDVIDEVTFFPYTGRREIPSMKCLRN